MANPVLDPPSRFQLPSARQRFSVVIPVRNEARVLQRLLSTLHERLPESADEVVLVLNGCTDSSANVVDIASASWIHPARLTCIGSATPGKAEAIALGLAHVTSPFSVLWDADLEYGFAGLPYIAIALTSDTLVSGCRPPHLLKWRSVLANAAARLALRTVGPAPLDVLTGVHGACTQWLRSVLGASQCQGYELEVTISRAAIIDRLYQVDIPVPYRPRSFLDGRGIRWYHLIPILRAALGLPRIISRIKTTSDAPAAGHYLSHSPQEDRV